VSAAAPHAPDSAANDPAPRSIALTLVSHTNVGKTTLMRTLLRRDIGEVADRAHVTETAEGHDLIAADGAVLKLWDTPGFGDSKRLLKRLEASGNPVGWFLTQVWDRFTDRAFFGSQVAVRTVRDETDVVLYLANASESPESAAYVDAEMRILGWIGKPVLVLLNQTGAARGRAADAADEAAWARVLAPHVAAHRVMAFDAFARCWVQEDRLLEGVGTLLPEKADEFARLRAAWRSRNLEVFQASMAAMARQLAEAAADRQPLEAAGDKPERAMAALGQRLEQGVRANVDALLVLHGLSGRAARPILERIEGEFDVARPADVKKTGIIGGMVSGALGGLAADAAAAGMTFGAGAIIGGILGALGAGGAAQAYNVIRGTEQGRVRWSAEVRARWPAAALLRYLAVAHYGRGRGEWAEDPAPSDWRRLAEEVAAEHRDALDEAFSAADGEGGADAVAARLQPVLEAMGRAALLRLYPEAGWLEAGAVD
jgi:hypothetical protein